MKRFGGGSMGSENEISPPGDLVIENDVFQSTSDDGSHEWKKRIYDELYEKVRQQTLSRFSESQIDQTA